MTTGVYSITCSANKKVYVGHSVRIERRFTQHRANLRQGKHCNPILQASWDKHGPDAFTFEIVEVCAPDDLVRREQHLIDDLGSAVPQGYNINTATGGPTGEVFFVRGERGTLRELCERFGVPHTHACHRRSTLGHSVEDVLFKPRPRKAYEIDGECDSLPNWCKLFGIPYERTRSRLRSGNSLREALGLELEAAQ